jgi:hypothetical protein
MSDDFAAGSAFNGAVPRHVEVLVALTWDDGAYSARCLGVSDLHRTADSMEEARDSLAAELSKQFSAGQGLDGQPDRTALWQPLPVEMIAPLDVAVG